MLHNACNIKRGQLYVIKMETYFVLYVFMIRYDLVNLISSSLSYSNNYSLDVIKGHLLEDFNLSAPKT